MNKKLLRILFVMVLSLGLATSASAITYTYTSVPGDTALYAGIEFTLDLNPLGGGNYAGAFTISTPSSIPAINTYYADWVQIMFDGGGFQASLIGPVGTSGGVTGNWLIMPINPAPGVDLLGFGAETFATNGRSGFYLDNIGPSGDGNIAAGHTSMSNGSEDYRWWFDVAMGSEPLSEAMALQVGFYDGPVGQGQPQTSRLSETLRTPVPEPATMLLLGSGLVGLIGFRRKFKK